MKCRRDVTDYALHTTEMANRSYEASCRLVPGFADEWKEGKYIDYNELTQRRQGIERTLHQIDLRLSGN